MNPVLLFFHRLLKGCRRAGTVRPDTAAASTGIWGENIAAAYLRGKKYRIVARRKKIGRDELDMVAIRNTKFGEQVVFVEVKTRSSDLLGGGRAAVDKRKRHALCRAAAHYLKTTAPAPFRFDIIEVTGSCDSAEPPEIRHFENAFPMELRFVHSGLGRSPRRRRNPCR